MPKRQPPKAPRTTKYTHESESYIQGALAELREEVEQYSALIGLQLQTEARVTLSEQKVCLIRDHLALAIRDCDGTAAPRNWMPTFNAIRFVGVRLGDACMMLLQEHKKLTTKELHDKLNTGMFRFRTSSPFREIHAAMIQQRGAKKIGDAWVWTGGAEEKQISLRMRRPERLTTVSKDLAPTGTEPKK